MGRSLTFTATDEISRSLADADPELGTLIDRVGHVDIEVTGGGFQVMVESIVSQQLSVKAAATISRRLAEEVGDTPEALAAASHEALRAAGLSNRKAEYVKGIAVATLAGDIDWDALEDLSADEVIERLVALRGVGRWTAEMYLIFGLGRLDVLAVDDFGLRNAAGRLFGLDAPMAADELATRGEAWRPYRSVASLWLWASVGAPPPEI
jgi:DNA-3-methyladenine glycosylase II